MTAVAVPGFVDVFLDLGEGLLVNDAGNKDAEIVRLSLLDATALLHQHLRFKSEQVH